MYTFAQRARELTGLLSFFTRGRFSHTVDSKKKSKKTKEEIFSKQIAAHETTPKSRRQSSHNSHTKKDKRICTLPIMEALPNFFGNAGGQQSAEETGMDVDGEEVLCVIRCGRLRKVENKMKPDPTKGKLRVVRGIDSLTRLQYGERNPSTPFEPSEDHHLSARVFEQNDGNNQTVSR